MDTKKARKWAARKLGELLQYVKFESQNITIRINLLQYLNAANLNLICNNYTQNEYIFNP